MTKMDLNQFHLLLMMSTVPMPVTDFDAADEETMINCYYCSMTCPVGDPLVERVTMVRTD